ncbi:peroxiredoxin [Roseitranquillus sediminis]|uniref:peroxiredoxin n=1 Tax=Roseitranquillus sediminis TaxID=2809051 RepID=UPI001D0CD522|nr:peroxiredoxin [Roseitranquillus sediminis]MBM9593198.1 peroxiredoxin [Roseitranquillus sediminis]
MTIAEGDRLPGAHLLRLGEDGPEQVDLSERLAGRRVAIFGFPGAFTPTCDSAHMPSLVRTSRQMRDRGVDEVMCIAVNDPFVLDVWSKTAGAAEAGITVLADAECAFTEAIGMRFDAPPRGLIARSQRYSMLVEDGVVRYLQVEQGRGVCELTTGESMLEVL